MFNDGERAVARMATHLVPLIALLLIPALVPVGGDAAFRQSGQQQDAAILTPTRLWGTAPLHPPLPPGCQPEEVLLALQNFLTAVNDGDRARLASNITELVQYMDRSQTPEVNLTNASAMLDYFAARHEQGLIMQLTELRVLGLEDPPGTVWLSFSLDRYAADVGHAALGGKGGFICESLQLYLIGLWAI